MRLATLILAAGLMAIASARADDDRKSVTGGIEIGYRDASVDGSESKYREDVNLPDGALRLFGLDLAWRPAASGAIDELTLDASGLGGEPHSSARLRARKVGRWKLDARFRSSDFFYRDAGYFFRDGGDLHTWDATRTFYGVDLEVRAADWVTLRVGGDRIEREGFSTTSRYIQRDGFVLRRPVDQTATAWWLGADFRMGWADLTVEQRLASYENRWLVTTVADEGEEPGGAALDAYRQLQTQDADAPVSRIALAGRPTDWLRFAADYVRVDAELDYAVDGSWEGVDYGSPPEAFSTVLSNAGKVERTVDVWTADLSVRPVDPLELTIDASRRSYDQNGTIDWVEEQTGGAEQGTYTVRGALRNELELDGVGLSARWEATETLDLSAGVGYQKRTAAFEIAGPEVATKRTLYRLGLRYRPKPVLDLRFEAEQGSDDDPYTAASPTDIDRLKASLTWRPSSGLRFDLRFKDETRENDLRYPLGLATDDDPPVTEIGAASFDVTAWGASFGWSRGDRLDLALGYDRTEIDSDADLVYVTGSTFFPVFDIFTAASRSAYTADQDVIYGRFRFGVGTAWSIGASVSLASNDGTFPVDWDRYGADARYLHGSGLYGRIAFDRYSLDETNPYAGDPAAPTPDVNDYDADLWTVALGYRF